MPAETALGRAVVLPGRLAAGGLATALALVRALAALQGASGRVTLAA
jgi:hypothetical protein